MQLARYDYRYMNWLFYYPRDAMLARVLAMTLCPSVRPSVCLSVTSRCSVEMDGSSWFWHVGFFRPILDCVIRKFRHLQK